jgi:hypothetical protein
MHVANVYGAVRGDGVDHRYEAGIAPVMITTVGQDMPAIEHVQSIPLQRPRSLALPREYRRSTSLIMTRTQRRHDRPR